MHIIVPEASAYSTGSIYHHFTLASFAIGGDDREALETWAEAYAPRVIDGSATCAEMLDELDGSPWIAHTGVRIVDLGNSITAPVFKRLEGIVRRVVRDYRE